ncbi:hypothetical protein [Acinetobacter junii]|uniref:hypothetical protein n=1 Tax=Acinetobacter junii TaxID=40215 RepID=UPI00124E7BB3|nr:hypothetical protein [Acinetobacter junii]
MAFSGCLPLSHACWLITYPIAGWFGAKFGLNYTFWVLAGIATLSILIARLVWPVADQEEFEHEHENLLPDHPHMVEHKLANGKHTHSYVIDDLHQHWPR